MRDMIPTFPNTPKLQATTDSFVRDEHGVTAIEFGLIAPILFLVLYAFVEIGWAFLSYHQLGHAVYETARYAVVHGSDSSAPADATALLAVLTEAAPLIDGSAMALTVTWTPDNDPGSAVSIQGVLNYEPLLDVIGFASFAMSSSVEMVIAR